MNITKQEFIKLAEAMVKDYNSECRIINTLEQCGINIDYSFYNRALVATIEHALNDIKSWVVEAIYDIAACGEYCIDEDTDNSYIIYSIEALANYLYEEDKRIFLKF